MRDSNPLPATAEIAAKTALSADRDPAGYTLCYARSLAPPASGADTAGGAKVTRIVGLGGRPALVADEWSTSAGSIPATRADAQAGPPRPVDCRTPAELAESSARLWRLVGVWHDLTDEQQEAILAIAGLLRNDE